MDTSEQVNAVSAEIEVAPPAEEEGSLSAAEPNQGRADTKETSYGKFKSGEALVKAYNSLESEFTKRSQRLKELESKGEENAEKAVEPVPAKAVYEEAGWQEKVTEFIGKNPAAREFAEEIAELIMTDDALGRDKRCLETAFERVLARKYRAPSELAQDQTFIDSYILNNPVVKDRIIADYMESLSGVRPPELMIKKGEIPLAPPMRPRSLAEAGAMAEKILRR
jgi:hypothetical protein